MLNLSFAGTLGADPETRTAGSSEVTEFRVAVNGYDRKAKAKTTTWLKVNLWGARGLALANLCEKGSKVAGSGTFEVQSFTNRDGETKLSYVLTVQDLTLMSFKADQEQVPAPRAKAITSPTKRAPMREPGDDTDDDMPF